MGIYRQLRAAGITTRAAARLTGLSRATVTRKPRPLMSVVPPAPVNKLNPKQRAQVVQVPASPRFREQPPRPCYPTPLSETTPPISAPP